MDQLHGSARLRYPGGTHHHAAEAGTVNEISELQVEDQVGRVLHFGALDSHSKRSHLFSSRNSALEIKQNDPFPFPLVDFEAHNKCCLV